MDKILTSIVSHCKVMTATLVMTFGVSCGMQAQSITLGNCDGTNAVANETVTAGTDGMAGSALYYPEETMKGYEGCSISSIYLRLNQATGDKGGRVFITRQLDGTPIVEQSFTRDKSGGFTVTLDEPYQIDGSAIYIGFEADNQRMLPFGKELVENEEWVKRSAEGWVRYENPYSPVLYATVTGDNLPLHNIRLAMAKVPGYVEVDSVLACSAQVCNLGAEKVTSVAVAYMVDGEQVATETIDNLSVNVRKKADFTLKGIKFDKEGNYDLQLRVIAVNGGEDAVMTDNASQVQKVCCRESFTSRKVLLEMFSTELCTACPGAHLAISEEFAGDEDVVELCHHAGFYTDGLTIDASTAYEWFYADDVLYAPAMMIDRTNFGQYYPDAYNYGVPTTNASATTARMLYEGQKLLPAFATVDIQSQYSADDRKLNMTVSGQQLLDVDDMDKARLFVFLTEDSIFTQTQAGAIGSFWHRHTARQSVTPTWGEAIDLAAGYRQDYEVTLPDEWVADNMRIVAFVAKYDADDKNNCQVFNTNTCRLVNGNAAGISEIEHNSLSQGKAYNLMGIRVNPQKGNGKTIYIINGRKVIR